MHVTIINCAFIQIKPCVLLFVTASCTVSRDIIDYVRLFPTELDASLIKQQCPVPVRRDLQEMIQSSLQKKISSVVHPDYVVSCVLLVSLIIWIPDFIGWYLCIHSSSPL